jgi:HEAT repeat protein
MKRKSSRFAVPTALFLLTISVPAAAQTPSPQPSQASTPSPSPSPAIDLREKRLAIFKFGIDQDVTDLMKTLESEKNDSFNQEILSLIKKTRSSGLKRSMLDFLSNREWKGAEETAAQIVRDRGTEAETCVIGALSYGAMVKSAEVLKEAVPIFSEREPNLMPALIRLSGRAGGPGEESKLLAFYEGEESTEANKQDVILALGDIGTEASVDFLLKLVDNADGKKFFRMYACDSLGRLKNEKAVPSLAKAANDADPNVRVYAVTALGKFSGAASEAVVIEALRDSFEGVRVAAAKSIGSLKLAQAEDFLRFKVENDKSSKVKEESLHALLEIGTQAGIEYVSSFFKKKANPESLRLKALAFLLAKKDPASYPAIREGVLAESKEKLVSLYQRMAKAISESENPELEDLAAVFLGSTDYIVRIYGLDWLQKNKAPALRPRLEELKADKVDAVKKRAERVSY